MVLAPFPSPSSLPDFCGISRSFYQVALEILALQRKPPSKSKDVLCDYVPYVCGVKDTVFPVRLNIV